MTSVMSPPKKPLSAQQAEDRKVKKELQSAERKASNEEVKALLQDLRYLALFPSSGSPEEIRSAATRAISQIQRKNSKLVGMEVLDGLDAH